jgi:hypothetical protein
MLLEIAIIFLLAAAAWPYIADFFSKHVIPWFRQNVSDSVADTVSGLFSWLDNKMTLVRAKLRGAWNLFKRVFLGGSISVQKISATEAIQKSSTYMCKEDGSVVRRVEEKKVPWEQLPQSIREEMIRNSTDHASLDLKGMKEAVRQRALEKAEEEGMELVLEM